MEVFEFVRPCPSCRSVCATCDWTGEVAAFATAEHVFFSSNPKLWRPVGLERECSLFFEKIFGLGVKTGELQLAIEIVSAHAVACGVIDRYTDTDELVDRFLQEAAQ